MSSPSCMPPKHFMAFQRSTIPQSDRLPAGTLSIEARNDFSNPLNEDADPFNTARSLSPRKITGLFLSGLAMAVAGRFVLKDLIPSKSTVTAAVDAVKTAAKDGVVKEAEGTISEALKQDELNIWLLFQDQLTSLYRLALHEPAQRKTLMAYAGAGTLGYLSGSVLQGGQETWVRREETLIRAKLISRLEGVVKGSIQRKHRQDNQLREEAKGRIRKLLAQHQVSLETVPLIERPIMESLQENNRYFFEPTHRSVKFGGYSGGKDVKPPSKRGLEAMVVGAGFLTGALFQGLYKMLKLELAEKGSQMSRKIVETINVPNQEALFVLGWNRNKSILVGILGLTAAAKIGKLWIDSLREIEVTRLNANTEYLYQKNNWLNQDPRFHEIAEREALENDFKQLEADMPRLKNNITQLEQRVQTLLTNIGRNSAPKYFPMIPMVGLREARS